MQSNRDDLSLVCSTNTYLQIFDPQEIEVDHSVGANIAGFSIIFKATWGHLEVAVKEALDDAFGFGLDHIDNEITIIKHIAEKTAGNGNDQLLKYYGHNEKFIVMEYMNNGTLDDFISNYARKYNEALFYQIAVKFLNNLELIHRYNIIHRDIKGTNVLLDEEFNPKICDFGLSAIADENKEYRDHSLVGTNGRYAPEIRSASKKNEEITYSFASDIFNAALLISTLLNQIQYLDINSADISFENIPQPLSDFILRGLNENPKERMTAGEAKRCAEETLEQFLLNNPRKCLQIIDQQDVDLFSNIKAIHGKYASIYRGQWERADIALKYIWMENDSPREALEHLEHEISIIKYLAENKTNNSASSMLKYYGYKNSSNDNYIVMEYMNNGTLENFIQDYRFENNERRFYQIPIELLKALEFLHSNKIIHRDLKCANLLLDFGFNLKICDFGLSVIVDAHHEYKSKHLPDREYPWAPEIKSASQRDYEITYSPAGDMYDVAQIIYILFNLGEHPSLDNADISFDKIPQLLSTIVRNGLNPDPKARMPASEAVVCAQEAREEFLVSNTPKHLKKIDSNDINLDHNIRTITTTLSNVQIGRWVSGNEHIAVKSVPRDEAPEYKLEYLDNEIKIAEYLAERTAGNSEKILLQYYGYNDYFIVMEYMNNGTIEDFANEHLFKNNEKLYYQIVSMILNAMELMHSLNLIHRDLKGLNILLNKDFHPKICDLGFAVIADNNKEYRSHGYFGTEYYIAPEIKSAHKNKREMIYSFASDMHAIAIVICLLFTRDFPSGNNINNQCSSDISIKSIPQKFSFFATRCLSQNPKERMTASEAKAIAQEAMEQYSPVNEGLRF